MGRAYVSRGWESDRQKKRTPLNFSKTVEKQASDACRKKRRAWKSYGIAGIFKNVGNVRKTAPSGRAESAAEKKRTLIAAGAPQGNVEIPWKMKVRRGFP